MQPHVSRTEQRRLRRRAKRFRWLAAFSAGIVSTGVYTTVAAALLLTSGTVRAELMPEGAVWQCLLIFGIVTFCIRVADYPYQLRRFAAWGGIVTVVCAGSLAWYYGNSWPMRLLHFADACCTLFLPMTLMIMPWLRTLWRGDEHPN